MTWTLFWDMHSGGGTKEDPFDKIYIEAPEAEATVIFYNRFGHSPSRVSCTCCGEDYSVSESETLEESSAYHRDLRLAVSGKNSKYLEPGEDAPKGWKVDDRWSSYKVPKTMDEYRAEKTVLIIPADEILPHERVGTVPEQGYVWHD